MANSPSGDAGTCVYMTGKPDIGCDDVVRVDEIPGAGLGCNI